MRFNLRLPDAEESYRRWVRPISVFLIYGAVFGCALISFVPILAPLPFLRSDIAIRLVVAFICVYLGMVGIGLLFRKKIAWYGLLAYLCFCVCFHLIILVLTSFDTLYAGPSPVGDIPAVVLGTTFTVILTVIVYLGTRPAFVTTPPQSTIENDASLIDR